MRVPFEATCAPSVASRVYCILCIPYVITKFIYPWPYQTKSRNVRSLALNLAAYRIHKRYCNLRTDVTIGQTFRGNSSKFNLAHILWLGRPQCKRKRCIVRLAKYQIVFEKIDNNRILRICHILSPQLRAKKKASRNEITHSREISWRMMPKYVWKGIENIITSREPSFIKMKTY